MASEFKIWDKVTPLQHPNGVTYSPEENMSMLPFTRTQKAVVEMSGGVAIAIDSLPVLESIHQIDPSLGDAEKLAAIQLARTRAQNPDYDAINEILDTIEGGFLQ